MAALRSSVMTPAEGEWSWTWTRRDVVFKKGFIEAVQAGDVQYRHSTSCRAARHRPEHTRTAWWISDHRLALVRDVLLPCGPVGPGRVVPDGFQLPKKKKKPELSLSKWHRPAFHPQCTCAAVSFYIWDVSSCGSGPDVSLDTFSPRDKINVKVASVRERYSFLFALRHQLVSSVETFRTSEIKSFDQIWTFIYFAGKIHRSVSRWRESLTVDESVWQILCLWGRRLRLWLINGENNFIHLFFNLLFFFYIFSLIWFKWEEVNTSMLLKDDDTKNTSFSLVQIS